MGVNVAIAFDTAIGEAPGPKEHYSGPSGRGDYTSPDYDVHESS